MSYDISVALGRKLSSPMKKPVNSSNLDDDLDEASDGEHEEN
jgi:hypothetical protein